MFLFLRENICASPLENLPSDMCAPRRFRSACAFADAQADLRWAHVSAGTFSHVATHSSWVLPRRASWCDNTHKWVKLYLSGEGFGMRTWILSIIPTFRTYHNISGIFETGSPDNYSINVGKSSNRRQVELSFS